MDDKRHLFPMHSRESHAAVRIHTTMLTAVRRYVVGRFARLAAAEKRIEDMAARSGVPAAAIVQQRPALRAFLRDSEGHFAATKTNYFFIDKFPENAARFPVTVEDCRRARAGD